MKKRFLCFMLLSVFVAAKATPVDETQAIEVGFKFLNATQKMNVKNPDALRLVKTYRCETGEAAFYVFNSDTGFVIVSADDCVTPILGYSYEGPLDRENIPVQMQDYLNGFLKQIEYGVANHLEADEDIATRWDCVRAIGKIHANRSNREIAPLLREKWDQGCGYNHYCPEDSLGSCGHAVTGCVATAMAQIMHYWRYPERGQGSHSYTPYTHPEYGVQTVNFSATTYDWDNMPYSLSSESSEEEIDAVATLMYHCGVAVDMMYGPNESGSFSGYVAPALLNYFKFSDELCYMDREDDSTWLANLKACLDLYRPVYYSGQNSTVAHAFVCDGYDQNDLLHFNWGWGGYGDGYFALNDIAFGVNNHAVVNIHGLFDPNHTCQVSVSLNSSNVGEVLGDGTYQYGDVCTLTAQAFSGCKFRAWLEDGVVVSGEPEITFLVVEDRHLEAFFDGEWSAQVEAGCIYDHAHHTQTATVSWVNGAPVSGNIHDEWPLLKSYSFYQVLAGVATDGNYIYTGSLNYTLDSVFYKWDFDGNLIESFNIGGRKVNDLTYDGQYFYGGTGDTVLRCFDLANHALVDVVHTPWSAFNCCAYDSDNDGFWLSINNKLQLVDRKGHAIKEGPSISAGKGAAYYKNNEGEPHLLYLDSDASVVYDYDINANTVEQCQAFEGNRYVRGIFIGAYLGKTVLFVNFYNSTAVYEIPVDLSQAQPHRVYRVEGAVGEQDPSSNPELIAGHFLGSSYTDLAFDTLSSGTYSYGVSLLTDGQESEIHWSNPVEHISRYAISAIVTIEEGGTVTGQGWYWEGETCTLTATANSNYIFTGWLKNGEVVSTVPEYSFEVTEDASYEARFEWNMVEIVTLVSPPETGTVTGQGSYEKGSVCTLTATPALKYSFLEWRKDGIAVSTEAVYSFTVTEEAEYEARFEQTAYEIQVLTSPQGSGEVTGAGIYNKGETVTLAVTPNNDFRFSQWTENGMFLSNDTTYSFVVTKDRKIYANLVYNHGVDEHVQIVLSLHPNPVDDHLVVECSQPVHRCEILSVSGALVDSLDEINESSVEIGVYNLSSGLYLIRVTTDSCSVLEKFVKQ